MHSYDIDPKERKETLKYFAVLAIVSAAAFNYLVQALKIVIPWYIDPPTIASFFGVAFWLFDNLLWRMRLGPISFSQIPDIRGTWVGSIQSSFQNMKVPVVVHIKQGWWKISIELESENSRSLTVMAALNTDENSLRYVYHSEPEQYSSTPEHIGNAYLHILRDGKTLKGKYYTSEGSNNRGTIILRFLGREIIDREDAIRRMQQQSAQAKSKSNGP